MSKAQILELAKRVRERISVPERWTQRHFAKNASGMGIYVEDGAVCWCWDGALLSMGATAAMRSAIAAALFPDYPNLYRSWDWNDSFPDHATMLADLDGRIRKYEESDDG